MSIGYMLFLRFVKRETGGVQGSRIQNPLIVLWFLGPQIPFLRYGSLWDFFGRSIAFVTHSFDRSLFGHLRESLSGSSIAVTIPSLDQSLFAHLIGFTKRLRVDL